MNKGMTIPTLKTPKGKMIHTVKSECMQMTPQTIMAITGCGKEFTGTHGEADSPEQVTCPKCQAWVLAELAAELAEQQAQEEHAATMVLGTPETVQEPPRRRYKRPMSPGRIRHGKVIQERAERKRRMKELLNAL